MALEEFIYEHLESILIGVLSSFVASLLFIKYLSFTKPRIKISQHIAGYNDQFQVKIVNRSRKTIYDLKFELDMITKHVSPTGYNYSMKRLSLLKSDMALLEGSPLISRFGNQYAMYALILNLGNSFFEEWNNDSQYLLFSVSYADPRNGLKISVNRQFIDKETVIKKGKFKWGKSTDLLSVFEK